MIFETEISSIGLPESSNQFYMSYHVLIRWYVHQEAGGYISPHLTKNCVLAISIRCENKIFNPKAEMLRVHDTSAAHSEIYKELGRKKYCRELTLTDWKQDDARKARRKSDVLVVNWQEGRTTNESMNELSRSWYSYTRCWNPQIQIQIKESELDCTVSKLSLIHIWRCRRRG